MPIALNNNIYSRMMQKSMELNPRKVGRYFTTDGISINPAMQGLNNNFKQITCPVLDDIEKEIVIASIHALFKLNSNVLISNFSRNVR